MRTSAIKRLLVDGNKFDRFQDWITPLNLEDQRQKFLAGEITNPIFIYPDLPKQALTTYLARLESITSIEGNGVEKYIYERKLAEKKLKFGLLLASQTDLTSISRKLYSCSFPSQLLAQAKKDAEVVLPQLTNAPLTAVETAQAFKVYLANYGILDWKISVSRAQDFYVKVRPEKKTIFISTGINWDYIDLDGLLAHEIDCHVLRTVNALANSQKLLTTTLPFRIKTEEGLACYLSDYCSAAAAKLSLKHHALKYLAGHLAMTATFNEVYEFLQTHGFSKDLAFQRTFRIKRGLIETAQPGLYAREAVYYEGMQEVREYIENKGDLAKLFAYKCGLADLAYLPSPKQHVILPSRLLSH